jgi:hypothetical protein
VAGSRAEANTDMSGPQKRRAAAPAAAPCSTVPAEATAFQRRARERAEKTRESTRAVIAGRNERKTIV